MNRPSAVVTGASRGIGRATALRLARDYHVIAVARSRPDLESLREEVTGQGGTLRVAALDLRDPAAVERALAGTTCDLLVNNAGVLHRKPLHELSPEEWNEMVDVNLSAIFHACRVLIPGMIERGMGHIINIASIAGRTPQAGASAYAATKHAVHGLSESLMLEVRDHGIRVSVVSPGSVATELTEGGSKVDWALRPADVAECVAAVAASPPHALLYSVEVRASRPRKSR